MNPNKLQVMFFFSWKKIACKFEFIGLCYGPLKSNLSILYFEYQKSIPIKRKHGVHVLNTPRVVNNFASTDDQNKC